MTVRYDILQAFTEKELTAKVNTAIANMEDKVESLECDMDDVYVGVDAPTTYTPCAAWTATVKYTFSPYTSIVSLDEIRDMQRDEYSYDEAA